MCGEERRFNVIFSIEYIFVNRGFSSSAGYLNLCTILAMVLLAGTKTKQQ